MCARGEGSSYKEKGMLKEVDEFDVYDMHTGFFGSSHGEVGMLPGIRTDRIK